MSKKKASVAGTSNSKSTVRRNEFDERLKTQLEKHPNIIMALAYCSIELSNYLLLRDSESFDAVFGLVKKQVVELDAKLRLGVDARESMTDGELIIALSRLFSTWIERLSEFIENKRTSSEAIVTCMHARLMKADIEKLQLAVRCLGSIARRKELTDALPVLQAADAQSK